MIHHSADRDRQGGSGRDREAVEETQGGSGETGRQRKRHREASGKQGGSGRDREAAGETGRQS